MLSMDQLSSLRTPFYAIDKERLLDNLRQMRESFGSVWEGPVRIGYSVKTNSLPWILSLLFKEKVSAEVVSGQEYRLAKEIGFSDADIIYNGPVKDRETFFEALRGGAVVNIDNSAEIAWVKEAVSMGIRNIKLGIRFNFFLEKECPGQTVPGDQYGRFGFNLENGSFENAVKELSGLKEVQIAGLHAHNSTKTKSLDIFSALSRKCAFLIRQYKLTPDYIDIGGCFFGDKPGAPSYKEYAVSIKGGLTDVLTGTETLILEPGAALIASAVSYFCRVCNTRDVGEKRFVTTDGSCIHIDPLMHGIQYQKVLRTENDNKSLKEQILTGFTCMEMDRIGRFRDTAELRVNDLIEFQNCGAYTMALSPLFIGYFPAVYAWDGKELRQVRTAWTEGEFLQGSEVIR